MKITKVEAFNPIIIRLECPADAELMQSLLKDRTAKQLLASAGNCNSRQADAFLEELRKAVCENSLLV